LVKVTLVTAELAEDSPLAGDHEYENPVVPEVPMLADCPEQKLTSGPALAVGCGAEVTTTVSDVVHPLSVVVTTYVAVVAVVPLLVNVTVGLEMVVLFNPVAGDHE
jgi:hypothetical protein